MHVYLAYTELGKPRQRLHSRVSGRKPLPTHPSVISEQVEGWLLRHRNDRLEVPTGSEAEYAVVHVAGSIRAPLQLQR